MKRVGEAIATREVRHRALRTAVVAAARGGKRRLEPPHAERAEETVGVALWRAHRGVVEPVVGKGGEGGDGGDGGGGGGGVCGYSWN